MPKKSGTKTIKIDDSEQQKYRDQAIKKLQAKLSKNSKNSKNSKKTKNSKK